MNSEPVEATTWAISDGAPGNARQALALAGAIDARPVPMTVEAAAPWRWLAPHLVAGSRRAIRADGFGEPWPSLAIGCGRLAALATRGLKQWSLGRCLSVQILDPRVSPHHYDLVIAPHHDGVTGSNVISTVGSLHSIDDRWLADARDRFPDQAALPGPRVSVLIGASNTAQKLDERYFDGLLAELSDWHRQAGGSFLVSTSRRTPAPMAERLRRAFTRWPGRFWSGDTDGENPYAGLLAHADRLVVTPDSVNMLSEASATGRPVHTYLREPVGGKLARFHAELARLGHLVPLGATTKAEAPLRELSGVAAIVRARRER